MTELTQDEKRKLGQRYASKTEHAGHEVEYHPFYGVYCYDCRERFYHVMPFWKAISVPTAVFLGVVLIGVLAGEPMIGLFVALVVAVVAGLVYMARYPATPGAPW